MIKKIEEEHHRQQTMSLSLMKQLHVSTCLNTSVLATIAGSVSGGQEKGDISPSM